MIAIIADGDDVRLPAVARELLVLQLEHLRQIEARIAVLDGRLVRQARDDEACRRLTEAPGIGPVIATAMVATVGNARLFSSGRSFAAWLGLTPRQHATGGKGRLLGISQRGDGYLRRQLMHGARSLVRLAQGREGRPWAWRAGARSARLSSIPAVNLVCLDRTVRDGTSKGRQQGLPRRWRVVAHQDHGVPCLLEI